MKLLTFIVSLSFISYIYSYNLGEICPRRGETCMHVEQCPQKIQDMVSMKNRPSHMSKYLRDARCGQRGLRKLCCTLPPPPPPQPECYTWDGRPGVCVHSSKRDKSMTTRQSTFSRCTKKREKFVCHSDLPVRQSKNCEVSSFPTDPSLGCCGRDRMTQSKIIGGEATALDQFPWLAVLKYEEDKMNCSGALISGRYVLTAAHCLDYSSIKPYAVVLGEYDKSTKYDCDETECLTVPVEITIGIEEIIVHEGYNPTSPLGRNDIALIRLMKTAKYSDFIQPICLPISDRDTTKHPPANFKLWSAGWGDVNATYRSPSDVKRKVELPYVDPWMCAGGDTNKDSCFGDSGSPLMYDRDGVFEVLGITSFGIAKCGTEGTPGIYTKVYSYLSWIHRHIRP